MYSIQNIATADFLEELKCNSSRWIKAKDIHYQRFAWQGGYGCFSVSPCAVDIVKRYIANQKPHHGKQTVKDEYVKLLKENDVEYHDDYLLDRIKRAVLMGK